MNLVAGRHGASFPADSECPVQWGFAEETIGIPRIGIAFLGLEILPDVSGAIQAQPEKRTSFDTALPAHDEKALGQILDRGPEAEEDSCFGLPVQKIVVV